MKWQTWSLAINDLTVSEKVMRNQCFASSDFISFGFKYSKDLKASSCFFLDLQLFLFVFQKHFLKVNMYI